MRETWTSLKLASQPLDSRRCGFASRGQHGLESIPGLHADLVEAHADWTDTEGRKRLSKALQKAIKPVNNTALPPRYRRSMVPSSPPRAARHHTGEEDAPPS